ncbi:MAG: hypothetical protein PUF63_01925 [Prevotella sp.]|nr:hypothetical protein [Prevotella sp.]
MKNFKLFVAAMALLNPMGGAYAATVDDGTYYLYDAADNLFFSRGGSWGTECMMSKFGIPLVLANQSDGSVTLHPADWNGTGYIHIEKDKAMYTDNPHASHWTLEASGDGYVIKSDSATYVKLNAGNLGYYLNAVEKSAANGTVFTLKTPAEYKTIVDAYPTANYSSVSTSAGWTGDFLTTLASKTATVVKDLGPNDYTWTKSCNRSDANSSSPREVYQGAGNFKTQLTGLQKGVYKVAVHAFERASSNAFCASLDNTIAYNSVSYIEANGEQARVKGWAEDRVSDINPNSVTEAGSAFTNGKYLNEVYAYVGDEGTLDLKVAVPDWQGSHWFIFGNTTVTYYSDLTDAQKTVLINTAESVGNLAMNADVKTALTTALTNFKASATLDTYNTLSSAVTDAENSANAYASAKTALDNREKLYENNNFITADAYKTYYTEPLAKYDARTLTTDEANAINNPYAISGWRADANTNKFMGSAYGITDYNGAVPYVNTWSKEGESDGSNFKVPFYEYWVGDGDILGDKTLTTTKTGLTAGKVYKVTAWVRTRLSNKQTAPVKGITMDAGGSSVAITGTQVGSSQLYLDNYTVYGTADSEGTLTVNFKVAGTNANWLSFQNLKYEEATVTALDESSDNTIADASDAYVTLNRSFSTEYYNSLVLPFSLTADQVTAAFGEGTMVYSYSNTDGDNINFATSTTGIAANIPVLIKTATKSTSFAFPNVDIVNNATPTAPGKNWNFVGSYNAKTVIPADAYEMFNNTLYKSNGTDSYFIKGFRAYIAPAAVTSAKPMLIINGVATSIDKVITNIDKDGNLYNLAGQRVSKNAKGIVIKNGKKVINK